MELDRTGWIGISEITNCYQGCLDEKARDMMINKYVIKIKYDNNDQYLGSHQAADLVQHVQSHTTHETNYTRM